MGSVAVIGGGIIGASIAWELARAGLPVTLFDRGEVGCEASTAGAGMLAPGGEIDQADEFGGLLLESARIYPGWIRLLEQESSRKIDYCRCGGLDLARSDEDWEYIHRRAARQQAIGINVETHADGIFYPEDAIVDPGHVMRALREVCVSRGVDVREHKAVTSAAVHNTSIKLDGEHFERGVLCAGAWSTQIQIRGTDLPEAYPVKGHLLGYQLEPGSIPHIVRHRETYILQRSSGFTIAGSSTEHVGFDKRVDYQVVADLQRRAERLLPMLQELTATVWTGLRPGANQPVISRYQESRLWLAYGHYRNGILAAPATAKLISGQIIANLETD